MSFYGDADIILAPNYISLLVSKLKNLKFNLLTNLPKYGSYNGL